MDKFLPIPKTWQAALGFLVLVIVAVALAKRLPLVKKVIA